MIFHFLITIGIILLVTISGINCFSKKHNSYLMWFNDTRVQGPSCNSNEDCGSGMACYENSCVCLDPEDMIYLEETNSCRVLADGVCFLEPIVGVEKECVQGAYCNPLNPLTGLCVCQEGDPCDDRLCCDASNPTTSTTTVTDISTSTTMHPTDGSSSSAPPTTPSSIPSSSRDPIPGTTPLPGYIGQRCDPELTNTCVLNAECVDFYCICKRYYEPAQDFRSCEYSRTSKGYEISAFVFLYSFLLLMALG